MSGGLTNPQGWNRYSYVANDPVNFYDPEGLVMVAPPSPPLPPRLQPSWPSTPDNSFALGLALSFYMDLGIVTMESDMGWPGGGSEVPEGIALARGHLVTVATGSFKSKPQCLEFLAALIGVAGRNVDVDSLTQQIMHTALEATSHIYDGPSSNTVLTEDKFPGAALPGVRTVADWFAFDKDRQALSQYNGAAIWIRVSEWESAVFGLMPSSFAGDYGLGTLMHELLHKQAVGGGFTHLQMQAALSQIGLSPADRPLGRNRISSQIGRICF
jgi:hypothetical protein